MTEKIYCGSAKEITTKYGKITKVSFMAKDLETMQANLDNGWVNIAVMEKKDPPAGKPTHYCVVDTRKPVPRSQPAPQMGGEDDEPLPF